MINIFNTSALSDAELQKRGFDYAGELSGNAPIEKILKNGVALEGRWPIDLNSKEKFLSLVERERIEVKFK